MKNPFTSEYINIKKVGAFNKAVLICSTVVTITSFLLYPVCNNCILQRIFDIIICLGALLYNGINIYISFAYIELEDIKRADLIDDAMGTNFSSKRTEDYFSNKQSGIVRIAANNFESCLYSYREITYDCNKYFLKMIIILAVFICSALIGTQSILMYFLKLSIPYVVAAKYSKMCICKRRFKKILRDYRKLFDTKTMEENRKNSSAIALFVEYETTLTWGQILLSDKSHETLKPDIENEWKEIRERYDL